MSTRANVIFTQSFSYRARNNRQVNRTVKQIYYRHHDGYPETVLPHLLKLTHWMRRGLIRRDTQQGSGWLMLFGIVEYQTIPPHETTDNALGPVYGIVESIQEPKDWKVGAYEPTDSVHGDINYLYTVDLVTLTILVQVRHYTDAGKDYYTDITADAMRELALTEPVTGNDTTPPEA